MTRKEALMQYGEKLVSMRESYVKQCQELKASADFTEEYKARREAELAQECRNALERIAGNAVGIIDAALNLHLKAIDGVPILRVPSSRMHSAITMTADGEGGYAKAESAVGVNWIICAKSAPIAVSKTDTVRIFPPEQYPLAHAWHVDYRKYHDLWLPSNKKDGVFVNLASA